MASANLWDTLDGIDQTREQEGEISVCPGNQIGTIAPDDLAEFDARNENIIYDYTDLLGDSLGHCSKIVLAAYKVADYTPDLSNNRHSDFWKRTVRIPMF